MSLAAFFAGDLEVSAALARWESWRVAGYMLGI